MIEVERLHKRYTSRIAVHDLTFQVSMGSVLGLIGPNGAGKTTTLRMLAGVLGPTTGSIRLCGYDVVVEPLQARRCLGYLPENVPLYGEMTVHQYLMYRLELKGAGRAHRAKMFETCEALGCDDVMESRLSHLSKGYRQRVGLVDALQCGPPVLLLDEPTSSLDPNQIQDLHLLLKRLLPDHAIVISTHIIGEIQSLCSEVLTMNDGRMVGHDSVRKLQTDQTCKIALDLRDAKGHAYAVFEMLGWRCCDDVKCLAQPEAVKKEGDIQVVVTTECLNVDIAIECLISELVGAGVGVRSVERRPTGLRLLFSRLSTPQQRNRE